MRNLTVIIPFLNEGAEICETVKSIRETARDNVDILLINDASTDSFDYEEIGRVYKVKYMVNKKRLGPAFSRDLGIGMIETDYFLTVDGHMRFYDNDWWKRIVEVTSDNQRAVYCANCKTLDLNGNFVEGKPHFGAYINFQDKNNILNPTWMRKDLHPEREIVEIPSVYGATYCSSKRYWQYIRGYEGLKQYGFEEPYISIKAWMEGGGCYLIKDTEIGHIFRTGFPYEMDLNYFVYNKLLILETLYPSDLKNDIYNMLRETCGIYLRNATEIMLEHRKMLENLIKEYSTILKSGFDSFLEINKKYESLANEDRF